MKIPLLSKLMKKKRIELTGNHVNCPKEDWWTVLLTDEGRFCLGSDQPTRVRGPSLETLSPRCIVRTTKHPPGVMVWGSLDFSGVGRLKVVKGTMGS